MLINLHQSSVYLGAAVFSWLRSAWKLPFKPQRKGLFRKEEDGAVLDRYIYMFLK